MKYFLQEYAIQLLKNQVYVETRVYVIFLRGFFRRGDERPQGA